MTSPSRSALIVEFSGIPGVGKSSVAHAVAAALATTGQSVDEPLSFVSPALARSRRLLRKLRLAAFEAVTHPLSSGTLAIAVARSGQSMGDFVHRVQNWLVVRALFRRSRRRSGVHLFDQGVVQELCSIGYRGDWRAALRSAAPGADDLAPDLIVRVTAPVEAVQQRLAARAGAQSRLESLSHHEQEAALRRQAIELDEIELAWLERFGRPRGSRRVEVDNGGPDTRVTVEQVLAEVLELLARTR